MNKIFIAILIALAMTGSAQAACNDCILSVRPISNNLCQGEPAVYDIVITNVNDRAKPISLSAASDIPMGSDLPPQVVVGAFETETIRATFTPTQSSIGQHRISIEASGYGVSDSDDAIFNINDCYTADLQLHQQSVDLCEGSTGRVDFTVRNNGQRQDRYAIFVRGVSGIIDVGFADGHMSLAPGGSRTGSITLEAVGDDYGTYQVEVIAQSELTSVSKKFDVNLMNCYHVSVNAPEEVVTCPDAGLTYTVSIKNNGCVPATYSLGLSGSCRAKLGHESIYLGAGETRKIAVTLEDDIGECELTVSASNAYDSDSDSTKVKIMECYDVDLEIIPPVITACHGEPVTYDLKVTNTGYYADEYKLSVSGIDVPLDRDTFSLASGEIGTTSFDIMGTWCVEDEEIPFLAKVIGHASDSEQGLFKLLPFGEGSCADLELSPAQDPKQIDCEGGPYKFYLKNTGFVNQQVELSMSGGSYLMQPDSLFLRPKETRPVAVYMIPTDATPKQSTITIIATSQDRQAFLELDLDFEGPLCKVSRPVMELPEEPTLPILPEGEGREQTNETQESPSGGAVSSEIEGGLVLLATLLVITAALLIAILVLVGKRQPKRGDFSFPEIKSAVTKKASQPANPELEV